MADLTPIGDRSHADSSQPREGPIVPGSELLEILAEFSAGAGHEINNPLATIIGRAELLHRRLNTSMSAGEVAETRRDLRIIAGQAQRIRDMIGDLMLFARPPKPKIENVDLRGLCVEAGRPFLEQAEKLGVTLRLPTEGGEVTVLGDRIQAAVVISELIRNALESVSEGGTVTVQVDVGENPGSHTKLTIEDNGRGLTSYDRVHLFNPFYSGRNAGRGLGFGLCKCWRILELHGGRIAIHPAEPAGTIVIAEWPIAP
jgi:signal transduction histidine kinase